MSFSVKIHLIAADGNEIGTWTPDIKLQNDKCAHYKVSQSFIDHDMENQFSIDKRVYSLSVPLSENSPYKRGNNKNTHITHTL